MNALFVERILARRMSNVTMYPLHPIRIASPTVDTPFQIVDGLAFTSGAGYELVRTPRFARDAMATLIDSLKTEQCDSAVELIVSVDSQAVGQNWRYMNRHKLTLHFCGPYLYWFLLHRLGHLLNERRWATEVL